MISLYLAGEQKTNLFKILDFDLLFISSVFQPSSDVITALSCTKFFEIILMQREESAAKSNVSSKMLIIL